MLVSKKVKMLSKYVILYINVLRIRAIYCNHLAQFLHLYFIIQTTELFETLSKDEPENIECKEQTLTLDQVLKIVPNDSSSASLRIPKVANRPVDFKLNNGHTSELTIYIRDQN